MKIKECCDDMNQDTIHLQTEEVNRDLFSDDAPITYAKAHIWAIPISQYEEMGDWKPIEYCPFCGTKIVVVTKDDKM